MKAERNDGEAHAGLVRSVEPRGRRLAPAPRRRRRAARSSWIAATTAVMAVMAVVVTLMARH